MSFFSRIRRIHTWQVFFSLAAVLVVFSFFDKGSALDIHLHDTYIVLAHSQVILALAFLSGFFGLLYYALRGWLPFRLLSWLHVLITSLSISLTCLPMQYPGFAGKPRR